MTYTDRQLGYARTIVATGRSLGVTDRGIKIGLATTLVETNLLNYANRAVPGSLTVPYDAIGSDSKSVGLFQQQPQWWGRGDGVDLMDPATSARLFFQQLLGLDYNNTSHTPGWYAQTVQRSAYPARYDERFAEASALYDQIAASTSGGNVAPFTEIDKMTGGGRDSRFGARISYWLLHTEEGSGNTDPGRLADYCNGNNGVSYHYTGGRGVVCDVVDTDYASWSVLSANPYTINFCFAGSRANMSRTEWLSTFRADIRNAAFLAVQDAKKYGMAIEVIGTGGRYLGKRQGFADHLFVTQVLQIGTHRDVGPGFPTDVFAADVRDFAVGVPPKPVENQINKMAAAAPWLGKRITVGEGVCPDKRGRFAFFENGAIYWTPTTGARPIPTRLLGDYKRLGWEAGVLGYPVAYHTVLAEGDVQAFERGVLYHRADEADGHFVTGRIGAAYARNGYEKGPLGWVTSDEVKNGDGTVTQHFQNGVVHWSPDGVITLSPVGGEDVIIPQKH